MCDSYRKLYFVLLVVLALASAACESDDGGQTGPRSRKDSSSGQDGSVVEVVEDLCGNNAKDPGESDVDCGGACSPCGLGLACVGNEDCQSAFCGAGYVCRDAGCGNGVQDPGETGVDCGGGCPACLGEACGGDDDCATGYCKGGLCDVPTCTDGISNGSETGVDCGGDCAQCADGQACLADANCLSAYCKDGFCATPSCADGAKNQNESDVDCGGLCTSCANGKACGGGADCQSGSCVAGLCSEVAPSCDDGQINGGESDVDCGGACAGCGFGKACGSANDCASGLCTQGACAAPASCDDGEKNGGESDVDCGGPCKACASGRFCDSHADCLSVTCVFGVCKDPTCADEVKNQGESDVDCGGPCQACPDGKSCGSVSDCASNSCEQAACISCDDGKKNGSESDIDCGGSCQTCWDGKTCGGASDCQSGACESGLCCSPNACGQCSSTPNEICDGVDNDCDGQTDETPDIGTAPDCEKQAGVCAGAWTACKGSSGWQCGDDIYLIHHSAYQSNETTCDDLDNDCDGQTDEGLKNACGWCGPNPEEICNGYDDDCDGQTDELDSCTACGSAELVELYKVSSSWGFQMHWTHWFTMIGDAAFAYVYPRGNSSSVHIFKLAEGVEVADWKPGIASSGNNTILGGADGKLHIGACGYWNYGGYSTHAAQYVRLNPATGSKETTDNVSDSTNVAGQPCVVSYAQGTAWLGYWTYDDGEQYQKLGTDGEWSYQGTFSTGEDYGMQFIVDEQAGAHLMYKNGNWSDADTVYKKVGGSTTTICDSLCTTTSSSCAGCGRPAMHKAPDGSLHVVYSRANSVLYRRMNGSSWGAEESIDSGSGPNLGFTADGRPVVAYVRNDTELWVSTWTGSEWHAEKVHETDESNHYYNSAAVGVDTGGRYHIGLRHSTTDGTYAQYQFVSYIMYCSTAPGGGACTPDCSSKVCGSDGCGGSCGDCSSGGSCNASGQCGTSGGGDGCTTLDQAGCGGCACEACVCAMDDYCCNTEWDGACVDACGSSCGSCGG